MSAAKQNAAKRRCKRAGSKALRRDNGKGLHDRKDAQYVPPLAWANANRATPL